MLAAGALAAVPGIAGLFLQSNNTAPERQLQGNMNQIGNLSNLMTNPDDPRYKAMLGAETQGIQQNFLSSLRDLVETNRRQALMGRQQIFDPERRDESMFSGIVQAKQQAQQQANQNVLQRINASIQGLNSSSAGLGALAKMQNTRNNNRRQTQLAALGAGGQFMQTDAFQKFINGE